MAQYKHIISRDSYHDLGWPQGPGPPNGGEFPAFFICFFFLQKDVY